MPKFSILLCTLNRKELIRKCLTSIYEQVFNDYEIIVVDQSKNIDEELQTDKHLKKYIHIAPKGLSNARNVGLKETSGEYIALIDDDAVYDKHFFEYANNKLSEKPEIGILAGRGQDKETGKYLLSGMKSDTEKKVDIWEIFGICISSSLILRRDVIEHGFDEDFGIGARYNAAEETDIAFNCIEKGNLIYYYPKMMIYHPSGDTENIDLDKVYKYSIGFGAVLKKYWLLTNRTIYCFMYLLMLVKSCIGCVYYFIGNKKYKRSIYSLKGKLKGFRTYQLPPQKEVTQ